MGNGRPDHRRQFGTNRAETGRNSIIFASLPVSKASLDLNSHQVVTIGRFLGKSPLHISTGALRSYLPRPNRRNALSHRLSDRGKPPPEEEEIRNLKEDGEDPSQDGLQRGEPYRQDEEDESDNGNDDQCDSETIHFPCFSFLDFSLLDC